MIDWDEAKFFFGLLAGLLGFVALVVLIITTAFNAHSSWTCGNLEKTTGKPAQYIWFDTCYIEHGGEWMRYADYQKTLIARDALDVGADQ